MNTQSITRIVRSPLDSGRQEKLPLQRPFLRQRRVVWQGTTHNKNYRGKLASGLHNTIHLILKTSISLLLLAVLMPGVWALAIAPAQHFVSYGDEPFTGKIRILNNHQEETTVTISVAGELSGYITLDQQDFTFTSADSGAVLGFTLDMPPSLEPGKHAGKIRFHVRPSGDGMVDVLTVLESVVYIQVPYPGKHATANLVPVVQEAGNVIFSLPITNVGSSDIESARVQLEVHRGKQVVGSLHSLPASITSNSQKIIHLNWLPERGGEYLATARVIYDGHELELSTSLMIEQGEKSFNIPNTAIYLALVIVLIALIIYQYRRSKTLFRRMNK